MFLKLKRDNYVFILLTHLSYIVCYWS